MASVIVPELTNNSRQDIIPYIKGLLSGTPDVKSKIIAMITSNDISYPQSAKRPSHAVLVWF